MANGVQHPTIEPQDLFQLRFLRGGQLSPDGRTVVYPVSEVRSEANASSDKETEKEYITLYLLDLATGGSRQLTSGNAMDSMPRWSPDGSQIAFMSTRDEKPQIYVISPVGGEARRVTNLTQGVGAGPVWSPDGRTIAFTAPPLAEPPDLKKPYRITRHIYRFDNAGYLDGRVNDIWMADVAGGDVHRLTSDGSQNSMPQWSPDGTEVVYMASLFDDEYRGDARLRAVSRNGTVREIIGDWGRVTAFVLTPEGDRIVFVGGENDRPIGSRNDLWTVSSTGGTPECLTAGLVAGMGGGLQADMPGLSDNASLPRLLLTPDGAAAYAHAQEGGTIRIYRVALTGDPVCVPVVVGERACWPLSVDSDTLLFAASRLDNPLDLYRCSPDGSGEKQLTFLNADFLAGRSLPTAEHLQFTGTDGKPLEGWILKPTVGHAPYPTILYIHGGPHSGFGHTFSFDFQMLAGAGYAVLFCNQRGSTGYGDSFSTAIIGDWGNHDYTDLMAGVDSAIERGIADGERLGVCGLSGGGNLSCWIVGQTNRFRAAVPENPVTNWVSFYGVSDIGPWFATSEMGGKPHEIPDVYRRCSPISYAHNCKTPTLLVQGEADYRCPAEQSEQFYVVLKDNGCPVEMLRLPNSSHGGSIRGDLELRRAQNDALLGWMNRYVIN
ncbi:MAG: S9 family peptidase [Herpetosiphon sp.]